MMTYILASVPVEAAFTAMMILVMVYLAICPTPRKDSFKDFSATKPTRPTNADSRRRNTVHPRDKHIVVRQNDNDKRYRVNRYGEVFEE